MTGEVERLPSNLKVLSSNPSTGREKKSRIARSQGSPAFWEWMGTDPVGTEDQESTGESALRIWRGLKTSRPGSPSTKTPLPEPTAAPAHSLSPALSVPEHLRQTQSFPRVMSQRSGRVRTCTQECLMPTLWTPSEHQEAAFEGQEAYPVCGAWGQRLIT
jgi:hypothetical protein